MSEKTEKTKKTEERDEVKRFREGLLAACMDAKNKADAVRLFLCTHDIPYELRGSKDRTNGFFFATTILKTFGPTMGIGLLLDAGFQHWETAAAYHVVAGAEIDDPVNGDPKAAGVLVRRELAHRCRDVAGLVQRLLKLDSDPGQHHSLLALVEECKWCVREVCGEGERT